MVTRNGSVFYEVNPDYPLIQDLYSDHPEIKDRVNLILQQIGYSIPLNSLYLDLTNDEKIDNDSEKDTKNIIAMVKAIIAVDTSGRSAAEIIESLKLAEPFCSYTDEIDTAFAGGEI